MKQPEDMRNAIAWTGGNRNLRYKAMMEELVSGEDVDGDEILQLGLWLVTEVLRRNEVPSFRRGFLAEGLKRAREYSTKYSMLQQCWPGAQPPHRTILDFDTKTFEMLSLLAAHSPGDPNPFDTSGDI